MKSALHLNLYHNIGTLPLHKGTCNGQPVWYVITDASDAAVARSLGVNFAPRLANLLASPGQVQPVTTDALPLGRAPVTFAGTPDFAPMRRLLPSETGFPPMGASPGGSAKIVVNCPALAFTHDRPTAPQASMPKGVP